MDKDFHSAQRIARLTPLADVLAMIARAQPVAPREVAIADALGRALAADVMAARALPEMAVALKDGFALRAEETADASAYAPIPLAHQPVRIGTGEKLAAGADAVAPFDAIVMVGGSAQVIAPVTAGDGILLAGADASPERPLCKSGQLLRPSDVGALAACRIGTVKIREPRIAVAFASVNEKAKITAALIASAIEQAGCRAMPSEGLDHTLKRNDYDAIFAVGGTGSGRDDLAVETLAKTGNVTAHGIGLMPGETSALGFISERPVLLLPGRIDAALSVWLTIGLPLIARLRGAANDDMSFEAALTRKVTSTIGIIDVVLVRRDGDKAEPLASGYWPMQAITRANGWIAVPAQSEGYAKGSIVTVRPLP